MRLNLHSNHRKHIEELQQLNERLSKEQQQWYEKQKKIIEMDEKYRYDAWEKERQILEEKIRVQELSREQRLRHIAAMEERARHFMEEQQRVKDLEMRKLKEELDRRIYKEQLELRYEQTTIFN